MNDIEKLEKVMSEKYGIRSCSYMTDYDRSRWDLERSLLQDKINSLKAAERYGAEYKQSVAASDAQRLARGEIPLTVWIKP